MAFGDIPATITESKSGKPMLASEMFSDSGEVRTYCRAMITADDLRSRPRAEIEGIIAGAQPIDPVALAAKKLQWYPNACYRGMEGYIQAPQTAFYDLVTEADPCIDIALDYGTGGEKEAWEDSIEKNWTWLMLKKWRMGFNYHIPMCQRQMLVHGVGAHVWPQMNAANWIERTPMAGNILFPDDAPVNFEEEGEAFMLRDFIPLHRLYQFIKNEDAAKKLGWEPDNVWKAMARVSKAQNDTQGGNFESYIRKMKRNDQGGSMARQSGVWVNWLFVRELDSAKVSLYAVAEREECGYLFKKRNLYDQWPLALFPYDIGLDGTLHSIRGLGARSKDFFQLSDRIKNTMAAQVILGSTVVLQQTGNFDRVKDKLLKLGMMTVLPKNLQLAQGLRFPDLSQGPLALDAKLSDTLRQNTQSYAGAAPDPMDRETALSYSMRAQDSAQVSKGAHGLYGSHLCNYWDIKLKMVLRAAKMSGDKPYIKMAKEFMGRCEKDGVPMEAFEHIVEVREVMSTGAGSAAARIQSFIALINSPVYANTSEDRKLNIERDFTAALITGSKVDRYARSLNDGDMTDEEDSFIALENDVLLRGGKAVVAPRQNQVRHAQGHLEAAGGIVQMLEQGQIDPQVALGGIRALGQHTAIHLEKLKENPTRQGDFKALQNELMALASVADKLQHNIDEQMEAEAEAASQIPPEQQVSEKGQIDLMKAQSMAKVRDYKAENANRRAWLDMNFRQKLEDAKSAAEIRRKNNGQLALR